MGFPLNVLLKSNGTEKGVIKMAYTYTTWTPDLITGHDLIDTQHQEWITAVNNLYDAQRSGVGAQEVEKVMVFLVDYTAKHFAEEEALQKEHGYPNYFGHKQIHADFTVQVKDLAKELRLSGPTDDLISHVCQTIGRWVVNHIKSNDIKMAAYIRSQEEQ